MASSFISITEVSGLRRALYLKGAALPLQGNASWGGKQRVITTWYPGNGAQATQQILGPTESQTQWAGEWNTNRVINTPVLLSDPGSSQNTQGLNTLGSGSARDIFVADDIRAVLEDMFRGGSVLEVLREYDAERIDVTTVSKRNLNGTARTRRVV